MFHPAGETGAVEVTSARARFGEVRIVGDAGEELETTAEVDLLAAETTVTVGDAAPGLYSRVRLKLAEEEADPLAIDGRFEGRSLRLRAHQGDEVDLRCPDGERLDPGGAVRFDLDVDRGRWFRGVDLHEAVPDDGVLRLDPEEGSNEELAERVVDQVLGSFAIRGTAPTDGGHREDHAGEDDGPGDEDGGPEDGDSE